jgi:hypothetical protein
MKIMTVSLSLAISLIFSATIPVNASAKEPIFTNDIGESRKLLYGEKETFISCWSTTRGTVYLDVKVNGKWKQKAKSSLRRDAKYCSDKEYPGASKLKWTPDELSRIKGVGRTYILEIRERYGSNVKPGFTSSFTIPIYRSSGDLINDLAEQIQNVPKQAQPVAPTPIATPKPIPTPTSTPTLTPPSLSVGRFYAGNDNDDSTWRWVAVEVVNSSSTQVHSHRFYDVLIADSGGAIVDSSFETSFPILGPGQKAWYVTTQFNKSPSSQVVFQKKYSTTQSPFAANELPTTSGARLVTSVNLPTRKMVSVTVKNNSASQIISKSSTAFAVLFDSSGIPVYVARGNLDKSVLPGGSAEVLIGDDFTFTGSAASIEVIIGTVAG